MQFIRHGDVLIIPAKKLETDTLKKHHESVLLEGEVTGHAHRLPETVEVWRKEEPQLDEAFWLGAFEVKEDTPLSHEEHDTITLKPGFYKHYGQREYDPVEERKITSKEFTKFPSHRRCLIHRKDKAREIL